MAELRHQIPIDASPDKVFAASRRRLARSWWTADAKAEEKVGGKADFGFDKRAIVFRMKIEKLERGKSVVWSCHGDQPEWNGTTLTWDLEMFAICNSSWGELMYRLKNYVEGRNPGPHWTE